MNITEATEWINSARPLIKFIEEQGGPKMYEWVQYHEVFGPFFTSESYEIGDDLCTDNCAYEPLAVVAAICMWIMDVYWWAAKSKVITDQQYPQPNYEGQEPRDWLMGLLTAICEALGFKANAQSLAKCDDVSKENKDGS